MLNKYLTEQAQSMQILQQSRCLPFIDPVDDLLLNKQVNIFIVYYGIYSSNEETLRLITIRSATFLMKNGTTTNSHLFKKSQKRDPA